MCLWLVHTQALHEPAILLGRQGSCFAFLPWPLEAARLHPLVQEHKSVALPVQGFDSVPTPATEEKQRIAEWIQVKLLLNHGRKAVNSTAQVGRTAGNVHPVSAIEVIQHDFRIRSTVSAVAASAPEWISASAPAIRTVTDTLPQVIGRTGVTSAN